ncbi:UNVERIFIED_CONTAM: hypothetical protein PYX00_011597 [Menopon gallinae]|uniref:C2H2-type domain-containing protein n=1 Tax=Menopon gallinae TaxID=328185 RepID=A0AAW2H7Z2_9NEOP
MEEPRATAKCLPPMHQHNLELLPAGMLYEADDEGMVRSIMMDFDCKSKDEGSSYSSSDSERCNVLRQQHAKSRADFLQRLHTMQFDQIFIENLLLKMEEQAFFKKPSCDVHDWNAEREAELEFLKNRSCCRMSFQNFTEWEIHMMSHELAANPYIVTKSERTPREESTDDMSESKQETSQTSDSSETVTSMSESKTKMFKCDHENCNKLYTSAYGLRYHLERGHVEGEDLTKPYLCTFVGCRKRYKNANGLKYHLAHGHRR